MHKQTMCVDMFCCWWWWMWCCC